MTDKKTTAGWTGPARDLSAEYKPQRLNQNRGPALKFNGHMIATTSWQASGHEITFALYETAAGNWVASTNFEPIGGKGPGDLRAAVIDAEELGSPQAMRFAVMDFFEWEMRARSMLRDQLGWQFVQEVE